MQDSSNEEFLGYMEMHSKTPRALFHRDDVNRLLDLAGSNEPREERKFVSWKYEDMKPYLDAARKRKDKE